MSTDIFEDVHSKRMIVCGYLKVHSNVYRVFFTFYRLQAFKLGTVVKVILFSRKPLVISPVIYCYRVSETLPEFIFSTGDGFSPYFTSTQRFPFSVYCFSRYKTVPFIFFACLISAFYLLFISFFALYIILFYSTMCTQ